MSHDRVDTSRMIGHGFLFNALYRDCEIEQFKAFLHRPITFICKECGDTRPGKANTSDHGILVNTYSMSFIEIMK